MKSDGRQAKRLQRAQRAPAHSSFSVGFRFRLKLLGRFCSSVQYAAMLPNDGADAEAKSPRSLGHNKAATTGCVESSLKSSLSMRKELEQRKAVTTDCVESSLKSPC